MSLHCGAILSVIVLVLGTDSLSTVHVLPSCSQEPTLSYMALPLLLQPWEGLYLNHGRGECLDLGLCGHSSVFEQLDIEGQAVLPFVLF